MTDWTDFPTRSIDTTTPLFRIHQDRYDPAWFSTNGLWRFDPPQSHRDRYGVCYIGLEPLASYVEIFGRIRAVPRREVDARRLSVLTIGRSINVADLTDRSVLGDFGITAAHSAGMNYGPAQTLGAQLYDIASDGVLYRVRHDPAMTLEAVALFGQPGESPEMFGSSKTAPIPEDLIEAGREFGIEVLPAAPLP